MKCKIDIKKEGKLITALIPFDPKTEFNISKGTIYVNCVINDVEFKAKLMPKGNGKYFIIFNKQLMKNIGLEGEKHLNINLSIDIENNEKPEVKKMKFLENDTLKIISERKSIRNFNDKKIDRIIMDTILNAGLCAPSANNKRPFHFIVIENKKKMLKIIGNNSKIKMLENTTACIIICGDKVVQGISEFLIEDCSAATQNILLAIHSLGLGGVWCGIKQNSDFYKDIINEFKIPEHIKPISLIALGYTNDKYTQTNRYEINKIHYEIW
jgi:nitroreductase